VSLHLRRGDYREKSYYCDLHKLGYYEAAILEIKQRVPDAKFFVFSDDPPWCKEVFSGAEFCVVDCNQGKEAFLDMYLMTQCQHNIIANSTFSWWGAWLNRNSTKIVITPGEWFSGNDVHHDMDDLLPEDWLRIEHFLCTMS